MFRTHDNLSLERYYFFFLRFGIGASCMSGFARTIEINEATNITKNTNANAKLQLSGKNLGAYKIEMRNPNILASIKPEDNGAALKV